MLTILQLEGCCCAGVWLVLLKKEKLKLLVGGLYIICCYLGLQTENYVMSSRVKWSCCEHGNMLGWILVLIIYVRNCVVIIVSICNSELHYRLQCCDEICGTCMTISKSNVWRNCYQSNGATWQNKIESMTVHAMSQIAASPAMTMKKESVTFYASSQIPDMWAMTSSATSSAASVANGVKRLQFSFVSLESSLSII